MNQNFAQHLHNTRRRECAKLGMTVPFPAKFRGKCGLSGLAFPRGELVTLFRDKGICLVTPVRDVLETERVAAAPKCGCGKEATAGNYTACARCDWKAETWYDMDVSEVTRETLPLYLRAAS